MFQSQRIRPRNMALEVSKSSHVRADVCRVVTLRRTTSLFCQKLRSNHHSIAYAGMEAVILVSAENFSPTISSIDVFAGLECRNILLQNSRAHMDLYKQVVHS
jgi:hypothetical protein